MDRENKTDLRLQERVISQDEQIVEDNPVVHSQTEDQSGGLMDRWEKWVDEVDR